MNMTYLFGTPVRPARPSATGQRDVFVLGAYPSALHVRWSIPGGPLSIRAVAVADEPEPFWTGHDEHDQIKRWKSLVGFQASLGQVAGCGRMNGSSGAWVDDRVLRPLGVDRSQTWITDCVDTYFSSTGAAARFEDPAMVSSLIELGLAPPKHRRHPSETEIVKEALAIHTERLLDELHTARPRLVVTLGNAALRVLTALTGGDKRLRLSSAIESYGQPLQARTSEHAFELIPLAHPAAPKIYQTAHGKWKEARESAARRGEDFGQAWP